MSPSAEQSGRADGRADGAWGKGTGVRAPTSFKRKDILGQYVGELLRESDCDDTVHPLEHVSKTNPTVGLWQSFRLAMRATGTA